MSQKPLTQANASPGHTFLAGFHGNRVLLLSCDQGSLLPRQVSLVPPTTLTAWSQDHCRFPLQLASLHRYPPLAQLL